MSDKSQHGGPRTPGPGKRLGRPPGSGDGGRGLSAQIAIRVTPEAKADYEALPDEERRRVQEKLRRVIAKAGK